MTIAPLAASVAYAPSPLARAPRDWVVRDLGRTAYLDTFAAMKAFTAARHADTPDELWLTEHPPVFTLGLAGRREHVRDAGEIPVVACDRGGQVTYHGPGQIVAYLLLDMKRAKLGVRELVRAMEQALIDTLADYAVDAHRRAGMPGAYVNDAKIAALGLRIVSKGCYHGLALNVDMDLAPFARIDPCGYEGLTVIHMRQLGVKTPLTDIKSRLVEHLRHSVFSRSRE